MASSCCLLEDEGVVHGHRQLNVISAQEQGEQRKDWEGKPPPVAYLKMRGLYTGTGSSMWPKWPGHIEYGRLQVPHLHHAIQHSVQPSEAVRSVA
eukprot:1152216-Pelagomonas_calceolata.AAC.9